MAASDVYKRQGKYPDMPAAVKAVALPEKLMTKHQNSPVRIGRHYSQDHLLGNHNSVLS